jgi:hypothetical protein
MLYVVCKVGDRYQVCLFDILVCLYVRISLYFRCIVLFVAMAKKYLCVITKGVSGKQTICFVFLVVTPKNITRCHQCFLRL